MNGIGLEWEQQHWRRKVMPVGVDEVGRGCLAGPVVAAAVQFPVNHQLLPGICDSKLLSAQQRESKLDLILRAASYWEIGLSTVETINREGIVQATAKAMSQALDGFRKTDLVVIDGNDCPAYHQLIFQPYVTQVQGDRLIYSVAAASIVAKVFRDRLMCYAHRIYPSYVWQNNKGYGTAAHRQAILRWGITAQHRTLFVRKLIM